MNKLLTTKVNSLVIAIKRYWQQPMRRLLLLTGLGCILFVGLLFCLLRATNPKHNVAIFKQSTSWLTDVRPAQLLEQLNQANSNNVENIKLNPGINSKITTKTSSQQQTVIANANNRNNNINVDNNNIGNNVNNAIAAKKSANLALNATKKQSVKLTTQAINVANNQQPSISTQADLPTADNNVAANINNLPIMHGLFAESTLPPAAISVFSARNNLVADAATVANIANTTNVASAITDNLANPNTIDLNNSSLMHNLLQQQIAPELKQQAFLENKTKNTTKQIVQLNQANPYTIHAGSYLPAILQTAIDSDLPGTVIAKVNQAVFDSVTGNYLLIPQGSSLIGKYDANLVFAQSRILLVWTRLIFPNGFSMDLNNIPGVDLVGKAGLQDKVNYHLAKLFANSALFSLFATSNKMQQTENNNSNSAIQALAASLGQHLNEAGSKLSEKQLQVKPTITIRAGTKFHLLLNQDLVFPGSYPFTSNA